MPPPFELSPEDLAQLFVSGRDKENLEALRRFGDGRGVCEKLKTDEFRGVNGSPDDLQMRQEVFGKNILPEAALESWFSMFFECFKDPILIILIVAAVVSIIVKTVENPHEGFIDGLAILIAVAIVATVTATNDYNKQIQFRALQDESKRRVEVCVRRGGKTCFVGTTDLVVGDIVVLDTGTVIPADGVLLQSSDFMVNESALTGESDDLAKHEDSAPILLSGSQVAAGTGTFVVTAVGLRSVQGAIAGADENESDTPLQMKLDVLAKRIGYVGVFVAVSTFVAMMAVKGAGGAAAQSHDWGSWTILAFIYGVTIIVVAIPEGLPLAVTVSLAYSTRKMLDDQNLIRHLAACETMGSVTDICTDKTGTLTENRMTVVEGWFAGNIVSFSDLDHQSVSVQPDNLAQSADLAHTAVPFSSDVIEHPKAPMLLSAVAEISAPTSSTIPASLVYTLRDHLSINSTAVIVVNPKGIKEVKGSKTEGAGLLLIESLGYEPLALREAAMKRHDVSSSSIVVSTVGAGIASSNLASSAVEPMQMGAPSVDRSTSSTPRVLKQFAFSSARKVMTTVVEQTPGGRVRVYTTGGSDVVLAISTHVLKEASAGINSASTRERLSAAEAASLAADVVASMARRSLRTLGLAYREFESQAALPAGWHESPASLETDMTLHSLLGIKDPLRPEVRDSIAKVQAAGITVRMVTGDHAFTGTAIAQECGILRPGGVVLEGPDFRMLTPSQLDEILPSLAVIARCSPLDKHLLVRRLNGNLPQTRAEWEAEHPGHSWETEKDIRLPGYFEEWAAARKHSSGIVYRAVVGVTGDGTNDAPALKAADVGMAMGKSGTQVAQQASDIVILDDRFSSIVKAVMWGRSVYDNVQRFLQFQLTVNCVALALTFFAAVLQYEPPLNPVMMLWVNLIMDTLGALSLGTQPPTEQLLERTPYSTTTSLVGPRMWRHVLVQAVYQFAVLLGFLLAGGDSLGVSKAFLNGTRYFVIGTGPATAESVAEYISTFLFNTFVFCQIFNQINARSLTDRWDVLSECKGSRLFMSILLVEGGLQALLVELGGPIMRTTGLTPAHWGLSLGLAAVTFPLGVIMRYIPVPSKPSDYAALYQDEFAARMGERRKQRGAAGPAALASESDAGTPGVTQVHRVYSSKQLSRVVAESGGSAASPAASLASASAPPIPLVVTTVGSGAEAGDPSGGELKKPPSQAGAAYELRD